MRTPASEPERAGAVGRGRSGCAERWFGPPTGRSGGRGTHSSARCRAVRIASLGGDTVPPWDAVPPWDTVPHGAGGCLACGTHCRCGIPCRRGIPAAMRSRSRSVETSAGRRSHSYLRTGRAPNAPTCMPTLPSMRHVPCSIAVSTQARPHARASVGWAPMLRQVYPWATPMRTQRRAEPQSAVACQPARYSPL